MSKILVVDKLYALTEDQFVYSLEINIKQEIRYAIIHDTGDSIHLIFHDKRPGTIKDTRGALLKNASYGKLGWGLLNNNKLFYVNSEEDIISNDDYGEFTLHIISLDSYSEKLFKHEFNPVLFPPGYADKVRDLFSAAFVEGNKELFSLQAKAFDERKYWTFAGALGDGDFIYFYPWKEYPEKNNNIDEQIVVPFDAENEIFLQPFQLNSYESIYNGYIFDTGYDKDGFREIRVYKLNEEIYKKK